MADLMGRYASDIRLTHSALALATLQGLIDEATADLHLKSANILAALDTDLALAVSRLSAGLNAVLDSDQVINCASFRLSRTYLLTLAYSFTYATVDRTGRRNLSQRSDQHRRRAASAQAQRGAARPEARDASPRAVDARVIGQDRAYEPAHGSGQEAGAGSLRLTMNFV